MPLHSPVRAAAVVWHECHRYTSQVPQCLVASGASFMAIFCCGPPPDPLVVDVALAARRARGVVLLLDGSAQPAARGGCALLRTAAAAAADMLPPVTRVLWRGRPAPGHELYSDPVAMATAPHAGSAAANASPADTGTAMHGEHPRAQRQPQPALSRGAALQAVRAAVEGVLGAVPADDAPLMDAGLASAGAVQLVDSLSERIGSDLPGMPGPSPASSLAARASANGTVACLLRDAASRGRLTQRHRPVYTTVTCSTKPCAVFSASPV